MQTRMRFTYGLLLALVASPCTSSAASSAWTNKKPMPTPRCGLTACTVNGKIYAMGGTQTPYNSAYLSTVQEYDPATDSWTNKAAMPARRNGHAASVLNGKIYILGGEPTAQDSTDTVFSYDPATNTWATNAAMPAKRTFHSACTVNGKIYVLAGVTADTSGGIAYPTGVDVYDPVSDTWANQGTMRTPPRFGVGACVLAGKIYVMGGLDDNWSSPVATVEAYNPATKTWTTKAGLPVARAFLAACAVGSRLYAIGSGCFSAAVSARVDEYDPITDRWTTRTSMRTPRGMLGVTVEGCRIYAIGGTSVAWEWVGIANVEQYDLTPAASISRNGTSVTLSWVGALQELNGATGSTWQDVTPAPTSPWTFDSAQQGAMQWYRARLP